MALFAIGSGGLRPLEEKRVIKIVPGGIYLLGASDDPREIIVTRDEGSRFWYRTYPYRMDICIDTRIGQDLIITALKTWLKSPHNLKHYPETAVVYRRILDGGGPDIEPLENYTWKKVLVRGPRALDVTSWGVYEELRDVGTDETETGVIVLRRDIERLRKAVEEAGGTIVSVEDHRGPGGA